MSAPEVAVLDAVGQAELVRAGEVTPAELVDWAITRAEALNPTLNAIITPLYEQARDTARAEVAGPLAGVPYLVKDLCIELAGVPIAEGSRFLAGVVSPFDSELATRLRRAGLVILGKTNTPEFGMVPTCEPVAFGATRNPWDLTRSTSGSSGGSAAAVAAGIVPAAHANDLGGSIRYPASACGLFGLKPTRARNPLGPEYGDVLGGLAAEHALTRSVRDSATLLDATCGPALGDPYWAPPPARPFAAEVGAAPGRLRITFSSRTFDDHPAHPDCIAAVHDAARLCEALGHDVAECDFTGLTPEVGAAIGVMMTSAAAWITRYWIRRIGRAPSGDELEPITRAYWEAGEQIDVADYLTAVEVLQRFTRSVAKAMVDVDVWLTPTLSSPPLALGQIVSTPEDPMRALRLGAPTVAFGGVIANATGNPAMSVPLFWNDDGMPIGSHFLGRYGEEATLLRLAAQLEEARPWAGRLPGVHASHLAPTR